MEKMTGYGLDVNQVNIEKLKELFPQIVSDGKIDFDMLRTILGDNVDDSIEKYQFTWNGKSETIRGANLPTAATLIPCKDKSVNWDTTENLYIEGDNLEVLKTLQKTYFGKIKMIYIDPPYNTGHDFVYKDNFKNTLESYKEQTGQVGRANPEANGRFHTDWLNMIYSRLKLARDLLDNDGVIFISMADNEIANLLKICEEIFGKNNIEIFVWKKKGCAGNTEKIIGVLTEYIVCCFKNKMPGNLNYQRFEREYRFSDEIGPYNLEGIEKTNLGTYERPTMLFGITDPKTGTVFYPSPNMRWTVGKDTVVELINNNKLYFDYSSRKVKRKKRPGDYEESENVYYNLLLGEGSLAIAKDECGELLGNREIFDTPKPVALVHKLLLIGSKKDSIILDFFSGSATAAHAVMQLNSEDGGNRKFIMVQLPELCDENSEAFHAGYSNICEIGEERIRRAGSKIINEIRLKYSNVNLFGNSCVALDTFDYGFKVFKLESTNINPWDSNVQLDEDLLSMLKDTIKDGRSGLDVAYEIMLKYGVFDKPIKEVEIAGKKMFDVGEGFMIICLADGINVDTYTAIAQLQPKCVVFKEDGFADDNAKMNATYTLKRLGAEKVLCI